MFYKAILYGALNGGIAQLARAVALQAIGQGFKSPYLQKETTVSMTCCPAESVLNRCSGVDCSRGGHSDVMCHLGPVT